MSPNRTCMTVREYARLQREYVATLEPWRAAQAEHTVARAAYEKALRARKPPVTGASHTARNRSIMARNLVQGQIDSAHKVWRDAEAVWKATKKARFEALRAAWTAGRDLAAVRAARRRLAALAATEPGVKAATCEPCENKPLWVATLEYADGREEFGVAGNTYVGAITSLIEATGHKNLFKMI